VAAGRSNKPQGPLLPDEATGFEEGTQGAPARAIPTSRAAVSKSISLGLSFGGRGTATDLNAPTCSVEGG
jgi:hypothetical protein